MPTIVDWQIRKHCRTKGLVEPFNEDQVQPASYDVRLGPNLLIEKKKESMSDKNYWHKHNLIEDGSYYLAPGEFILGATYEYVRIPNDMECVFQLKSSRGREGFSHSLSAYIDAGFNGRITLELHNLNRYNELLLTNNMLIGQLRFMYLDQTPMRTYSLTGRYNGDMDVTPSKD